METVDMRKRGGNIEEKVEKEKEERKKKERKKRKKEEDRYLTFSVL